MRIVMMGTGPFAVPTFRWLLASPHDVPALITRPVRATRGRRPPPSPMREVAEEAELPIYDPADINSGEAHELLRSLMPGLFVVCDYGQLLSSETLRIPPLGGVNLHGSLLPKYRGAAPINWAIYHGETVTGVTVIHMTPRLDAGPILSKREVAIGPSETAEELEPRLAEAGVDAVREAIELLANWDGVRQLGVLQDREKATRAPRLKKEEGAIDWRQSARQIVNQVRAFQPWPGSYFTRPSATPGAAGTRLIVQAARVVEREELAEKGESLDSRPGFVLSKDGRLWVATGQGALAITRVQPAGKRAMDVADYLRGHPVEAGERLE